MRQHRQLAKYTLKHRRAGHKAKLKSFLLVIVIVLLAIGGYALWNRHLSDQKQANARQAQQEADESNKAKAETFASQLQTLFTANPADTLGVVTYSSINGLQNYGNVAAADGASDSKLLSAADYLHHVEVGSASLGQGIDGQNAQYLLQIMLVNSNDDAWADINGYLTHPDLLSYATSIGFKDYDPTVNTITPTDIAIILQKLYAGKLLNSSDRSLMLGYLAQANYREYIVPAVPKGDDVYHKIGLDDDEVNDAAIITHGQKYMVLVIFTNGNGTYNWPARAQLMQTITRDALDAYLPS